MPTNAISCPSKNLYISNLVLCSMLCAQAQSQMQFTIYCSPVFLLLCSQGLLTNSTVGNIPCSREGVQAGREFPIPHCQVWHQGSAAPSLPTLPLSVILSFFNTHTGPDLFHFAAPTPATLPAQILPSLMPHTTYLSVTQTRLHHPPWTRYGLPLPCPSAPCHRSRPGRERSLMP